MLDEASELPSDGGGVARVRAAPRRVRRMDQLGRQLPPKEPLRGEADLICCDLIHSSQFKSVPCKSKNISQIKRWTPAATTITTTRD